MSKLVIADLNFLEREFHSISAIKGGKTEFRQKFTKKFNVLGATAAYSADSGAIVDKLKGLVLGRATAVATSTDGPTDAKTDLDLKL